MRQLQTLFVLFFTLFLGNSLLAQPYPESYYELSRDGKTLLFWKGELESVNLAIDPVLGRVDSIADFAFARRDTLGNVEADYILEELILPPSLRSVGYMAFWCRNLRTIKLNEGLESIDEMAFCELPLKAIHLPASLYDVEGAFFRCYALEEITVAEKSPYLLVERDMLIAQSHGQVVRYTSGSLQGDVTTPQEAKEIGRRAFADSRYLTTLTLEEGVTAIASLGVSACPSLCKVDLPSTIRFLANDAFLDSPVDTLIIRSPYPPEIDGSLALSQAVHRTLVVPDEALSLYTAYEPLRKIATELVPLSEMPMSYHTFVGSGENKNMPFTLLGQQLILELPEEVEEAWLYDKEGDLIARYRHSARYTLTPGIYMLVVGDERYKVVVPAPF